MRKLTLSFARNFCKLPFEDETQQNGWSCETEAFLPDLKSCKLNTNAWKQCESQARLLFLPFTSPSSCFPFPTRLFFVSPLFSFFVHPSLFLSALLFSNYASLPAITLQLSTLLFPIPPFLTLLCAALFMSQAFVTRSLDTQISWSLMKYMQMLFIVLYRIISYYIILFQILYIYYIMYIDL